MQIAPRGIISRLHTYWLVRLIFFFFRIAFHAITVVLAHAAIYGYIMWNFTDGFTHFTLRVPSTSGGSSTSGDIAFWFFVAYFSFGLGILVWRMFRHLPALTVLLLYAASGITCWMVFAKSYGPRNLTQLLTGMAAFETMVAVGIAALFTVVSYFMSPDPPPFFPSLRDVRSGMEKFKLGIRSKNAVATGVLLLLVIQSVAVIILWVRLSLVENKLGGLRSLVCNEQGQLASVKQATVRIIGGNAEGTGMIIRQDGIVLTNAHVVDQEQSPKVILSDYSFRTSDVVYFNKDADIALLRMEKGHYPTVTLSQKPSVNSLEQIVSIGYPLGTDLRGDASVTTGRFISRRSMQTSPVDYLQYDGTINPGNSGGPIMTICGDVVGMSTSGVPGMGLAIASDSIWGHIGWAFDPDTTFTTVEFIKLDPDKSPLDAVAAFYLYIKMRKLESAYTLLSRKRINNTPLEHFVKGYSQTLDVALLDIHEVADKKNRMYIKLRSLDLVGQDVKVKYFEGETQVIEEDAMWKLGDSDIKEIKEPPWDWLWSK